MTDGHAVKSRWLAWFEQEQIEVDDESSPWHRPLLDIIRRLIEAQGNANELADEAVETIINSYRDTWRPKDYTLQSREDGGVALVILQLAEYFVNLVGFFDFPSPEQERITRTLIKLEAIEPKTAFNISDAEFKKAYAWGLITGVKSIWNQIHVEPEPPLEDPAGHYREARTTILFLGSLYQAGVAGDEGLRTVAREISRGLEPHRLSPYDERSRQCVAEISAQLVLMAGPRLAASLGKIKELDEQVWRHWASQFRRLADETPDDAGWQVTKRAQEAFASMVELTPAVAQQTESR